MPPAYRILPIAPALTATRLRHRASAAVLLRVALLAGVGAVAGSAALAQPAAPVASPPDNAPAAAPAAADGAAGGDAARTGARDTAGDDSDPAKKTVAEQIGAVLRKGQAADALRQADEFLARHPRDAQVRFLRAVALGDLNRAAEAAAVLEGLTQDFPELAEPYNNLAVIRANQGALSSAEHLLQQAIAAQPNYVTARENLGDLYIALAAAAYDDAARLNPASATLKRKLTLTRELGGKLHSAR